LAAFQCMLGKACMERDASCLRFNAVQQDFFAQVCISSSRSKLLTNHIRTLEEHQILLCLQKMDMEVWEAILAEEREHLPHPTDAWELSMELDKAHACLDRIDGERDTEAKRLSQWVIRISNVLVDLGRSYRWLISS
jgi:hypothetical protein